jgi:hypothetical protein
LKKARKKEKENERIRKSDVVIVARINRNGEELKIKPRGFTHHEMHMNAFMNVDV